MACTNYTRFFPVCFCQVTYSFQSESTPYSCLNAKELLGRSRRKIWSLSDCNWTQTQNLLVHKRTPNHLVKWPVWLNGWVFVYELSGSGFETSCSPFFSHTENDGQLSTLLFQNWIWSGKKLLNVFRSIHTINFYCAI